MAIGDIIHENDRVTMIKTVIEEGKRKSFITRVHAVKDNDHLEILMPRNVTQSMDFAIGERFIFVFQNEGSLYQSVGVITDRYRPSGIYVLVIRLVNEIEKVQRRQFFRVDCLVDIQYRYSEENKLYYQEKLASHQELSEEEREYAEKQVKISPSEWRFGTAIDISGGGIRFNCKERMEKGTILDIKLQMKDIDEGSDLIISSKVISSIEMRNRKNLFENRVEFTNIGPKNREKIIRYVFEKDRINRKRDKETQDV